MKARDAPWLCGIKGVPVGKLTAPEYSGEGVSSITYCLLRRILGPMYSSHFFSTLLLGQPHCQEERVKGDRLSCR